MKTLRLLALLLCATLAHGFGVVVIDAENLSILPPSTSSYDIYVENQVAITRVHSQFINPLNSAIDPVWAFPLPEDASATRLRYRLNGEWTEVPIAVGPQDPDLPGDGLHPNLRAYLGNTPIVFHFEHLLVPDSTLIVELDYVELLTYEYGTVSMRHPGDLHLILPNQIISSSYQMNLLSDRDITALALTSGQSGEVVSHVEGTGSISWMDVAGYADEDFTVEYQLDQNQLGLWATSTMLPDSLMPEDGPPGFLVFVAEPDPNDEQAVMDKVFTLILDRSGSMSGNKIIQARAAASFIVENLNEGDRFNLVSFSSGVTSFRPGHVEYTTQTESQALTWIAGQTAAGSTSISEAFNVAVPQFSSANDSTANIIIFFTDGQPTSGITNPTQLVAHVDQLFAQQEVPINLFCFGIGLDVNQSLLGQLAAHNNGFAEFLQDDELESRISSFYLQVRNPVLTMPWVEATPPLLLQVAPQPLPNLYTGHQMIVGARYSSAQPLLLSLHGTAFGHAIQYDYPIELAAGYNESRAFLPKVWAKRTIETLMVSYYQLDPDSPEALELHEEIVALSLTWGVVSPFTSFNDDTVLPREEPGARPSSLLLVENHPNPFNPSTTLRITVPAGLPRGPLFVRIYNLRGELVRTLGLLVTGPGSYEIAWNGLNEAGRPAASGAYLAVVSYANQVAAHRMLLMK